MAETELGKALEKAIIAGEKFTEALKEVKEVAEILKSKYSQLPPDDQPSE